MSNQEEFERKLTSILNKYKNAIESKDSTFLKDYVSHCLDRDVVVSPKNFKPYQKSFLRQFASLILKIFLIISLIFGLLLLAKFRIETSQPDEYAKDANYWLFFFRRWSVRFGLNKFTSVKRLYESDCLINNPYYKAPPRACSCGFTLKRYRLNSTENAQNAFLRKLRSQNSNPFIMKGALDFPVSYTDLRSMVLDAREAFDSGNSFTSSLSGASVSADYKTLFADPQEPPKHSDVSWDMNFVGAAHHMRSLFPRPFFIPPSQEVHLSRTIYMFGSKAPRKLVKLVSDVQFSGVFYVQAWGRRPFALKSDPSCKCEQSALSFMLEQGDMLFYFSDVHDLHSIAKTNETGYSLGYAGSVSVDVSKQDQK